MNMFVVHVAGHKYTVWCDDHGQIVETACKGRWSRTAANIGDAWLLKTLQDAVNLEMSATS